MIGLKLPLRRRPDPVLNEEELRVVELLLDGHIAWATHEMEQRRVSETIIRMRLDAESALAKVREALR
jgi:hypothetical protein